MNWFQYIGFVSGLGIASGGLGITIAHELIHKSSVIEQTLGKILLTSVCYGHFFIGKLLNFLLSSKFRTSLGSSQESCYNR